MFSRGIRGPRGCVTSRPSLEGGSITSAASLSRRRRSYRLLPSMPACFLSERSPRHHSSHAVGTTGISSRVWLMDVCFRLTRIKRLLRVITELSVPHASTLSIPNRAARAGKFGWLWRVIECHSHTRRTLIHLTLRPSELASGVPCGPPIRVVPRQVVEISRAVSASSPRRGR